jgi:hypothetical protein
VVAPGAGSSTIFEGVVLGGTSGIAGTFGHGALSADPTGGPGSLIFEHIDASLLSAGANRSALKGTTLNVSTRLTDGGTGTGIAGAYVGLYRRMGSGPWTLLATKITSPSGQALATVKVNASAQYEWQYAGALVHGPATSPVQQLLLRKPVIKPVTKPHGAAAATRGPSRA